MSYIALMEAQAKPRHIGYSMRSLDVTTGADALAVSREVHARLHPTPKPRLIRIVRDEPVPEPELPPEPVVTVNRVRRPHDFIFVHDKNLHIPRRVWNVTSAEQILAEVSDKHRVSVKQIKGPTRLREVIAARFEAYYRLHDELGYSLCMIGEAVGGKDHSGVLHGIRKHKERMEAAGL